MSKKLMCIFISILMLSSYFISDFATAETGSSTSTLPFTPQIWFPVAIAIALIIILISAIVYQIGRVISNQNAMTWSKIQIYEAFLSIIILIIFSVFAYVFLLNPTSSYGSVGLLPKACQGANNIFELSMCDIGTFTQSAAYVFNVIFYVAILAGNIIGFKITIALAKPQTINVEFGLKSILPIGVDSILSWAFGGLLFMMLLNNVQLITLSASLLFLSVFVTVGIIMRIFGITRSFGGVMIALGLAFGFVYPLLATVSYGFISTQLQQLPLDITCLIPQLVFYFLFGTSTTIAGCSSLGNIVSNLGMIIAGLTFIPFINFVILEAFIVDFSKAIGEQISFMTMLPGLI